jgi:large subunit ribosomal protein L21
MYAIVKTGGKQYHVEPGRWLLVERLPVDDGATVALEPLLYVDGAEVVDGEGLQNVLVQARVLGHERGPKLRIVKFKPKRGYRRRNGHRQELTRIEVTSVTLGSGTKPASAEATPAPAVADAAPEPTTPTGAPEATATEQTTPGATATEQTTPEATATEQTTPGATATEQTTPGATATEQTTPEATAAEETSPEALAAEPTAPESVVEDRPTEAGNGT